jgi:hypothetical protein
VPLLQPGPRRRRHRSRQRGEHRCERSRVDRFEADGDGVVGGPRFHDQPLGVIVVAPRATAGCGGRARHQADDVSQDRRDGVGVGQFEDEMTQFEVMRHGQHPDRLNRKRQRPFSAD